jgi:PTH1 family peptidyl-tRNA hydrolase
MKLIVGLGNLGRIYTESRHNIGFSVIRALSKIYKIPLKKDNTFSLSGKGKIGAENLILALPLTFMNLSGIAVSALIKKYKIDLPHLAREVRGLDNLLVVCDDLDLDFGVIKIRPSGSSGGHRGLGSIIDSLGSQEFSRLRVGIGRPPHQLVSKNVGKVNWCRGRPLRDNTDAASFVLSPFAKKEKGKIKELIENACDCCRVWAMKGIVESMNIFNRRSK